MDTLPRSNSILERISANQIAERVRAIDELDRRDASFSAIQQHVDAILPGYCCVTRVVDCKQAWRARKNLGNTLFTHVDELWYPKPELVKYFGRMNQPARPVFYISASHQTALLEARANPGDLVTILEIGLRAETSLPHVMEIGVAEKASQHNLPTTVNILENTAAGRALLRGDVEKNLLIRNFLAKEVTQIVSHDDTHIFKVSAAIYDRLTSSDEIDGVEYPSIAGDGTASKGGVNLAIKPASADRLFKPVGCFVIRVIDCVLQPTPGLLVECTNTATNILPDGSIEWA